MVRRCENCKMICLSCSQFLLNATLQHHLSKAVSMWSSGVGGWKGGDAGLSPVVADSVCEKWCFPPQTLHRCLERQRCPFLRHKNTCQSSLVFAYALPFLLLDCISQGHCSSNSVAYLPKTGWSIIQSGPS